MSKSKGIRIEDDLYELIEKKIFSSPYFNDFSSYVRYLIISDLRKKEDDSIVK